jgi:hypothetical protein
MRRNQTRQVQKKLSFKLGDDVKSISRTLEVVHELRNYALYISVFLPHSFCVVILQYLITEG